MWPGNYLTVLGSSGLRIWFSQSDLSKSHDSLRQIASSRRWLEESRQKYAATILAVKLLRSAWSLPELHPEGLFSDSRLKSHIYTNFKFEYLDLNILGKEVKTSPSASLVSKSVYHSALAHLIITHWPISVSEPRPVGAVIWGFPEKKDVVVVFQRHTWCTNVHNPWEGPPLLVRSLCVQWGPRNQIWPFCCFWDILT